MSEKSRKQRGTPSKTNWSLNQCAQIQAAFIKAVPNALGRLRFNPGDLIRTVQGSGEEMEVGISRLLKSLFTRSGEWHLKNLKLIAGGIAIATESFAKEGFFTKNGPVKLYFWDNFANWILKAIPETVPAFQGKLTKTQLTESMYDSAILNELGNPKPFTVGESVAIIRDLLTKQPNGESGELQNNGYANIFYVQLENARVLAVYVHWYSDYRGWGLGAHDLDDDQWFVGYCVFSRS